MGEQRRILTMTELINRHDLPPGTFLDARKGMKLAYGILWHTWIDRSGKEGRAASIARKILRAELSKEECGEGIALVRQSVFL